VIKSGELVVFKDFVGVASDDVQPSAEGVYHVEGVYRLPLKGGITPLVGQRLYYIKTDKVLTTEVSNGLSSSALVTYDPAGVAWNTGDGSTVHIKINV
jgi:predicted RecA/RadA family phage recombinase